MDLMLYSIPLATLIVALVELAKRQGLPDRYAPLLATGLGVLLMIVAKADQPVLGTWFEVTLQGLAVGLTACGLYSGVRAVAER
jgi:hypothetical protein